MPVEAITYYWRPGCPFCMNLERNLDKLELPLDKRNIWDDPEHAAAVRSIADGNETVPTVVVGDASLVNPSATQVIHAVAEHAPDLLPEDFDLPEEGRVSSLVQRLLGG